ncbi:MAG: Asp-tRNA(Asn)/Glu-tRNA(Gln) amidotransferase GatCAB subunit B, partial [Lentisphaeria bacterium]|nr:Asp-tRNA(Asn)/Glu-tRNA(Gln) amidotransferase GatCAB subunit B [Lentisphaeria bacterium]
EIKNLNSFRAVHRALEYEIWRQGVELDAGHSLRQETRGWNDEHGETYVMRVKEQAHDYRYFPDPDLAMVRFTAEEIEAIRRDLPELPAALRARLVSQYGLTEYDADVLTQDRRTVVWFERAAKDSPAPKTVANWIISELLRLLGESGCAIDECAIAPEQLGQLVSMIEKGTINGKIAKEVFAEMFTSGKDPAAIVEERGLTQVSDEGAIAAFVDQAVAANPAQVEQFRAGNEKVLQFFVGQVMKLSRGKANPQLVVQLLKEKL